MFTKYVVGPIVALGSRHPEVGLLDETGVTRFAQEIVDLFGSRLALLKMLNEFHYVVRREVDPDQARWVRKIFTWYADGYAPRWIASELNRLGVPSLRGGTWAASVIYGEFGAGDAICIVGKGSS